MKKLFITISLLFMFVSTYAQVGARFGFTASPAISWYSADHKQVENEGMRFSLNYGALVDIVMGNNERYAISTGMTINIGGGKLKGINPDDPNSYSVLTSKVQYLEIPVGLKLRSNESASNLTFYGNLGLVNGFRIRARADIEYFDEDKDKELELLDNVKFKELDFFPSNAEKINVYQLGLHFEAGTEFRVSDNTSIVGGLFFRNGFTNVIKDEDDERVVQRNFGLRIAVMF